MYEERFTPSGVRLRARARRAGDLNWLFLPGGPGIGSESLHELVDAVAVPGTSWLVDLPGDGSNTGMADPFARWPQVVAEAAEAVERPVFVGHSTGGMYLLATPALEPLLEGLVLVSTAPSARWMDAFVAMTRRHPLPAVEAATARYEADPTDEHLREIAVHSAPWNFNAVEAGAELLGRMPYNRAAVDWSAEHFDTTYTAAWWPDSLPTLIISGSDDRIVDQTLWGEHAPLAQTFIDGGGHFPWIERPAAVHDAFARFSATLFDT